MLKRPRIFYNLFTSLLFIVLFAPLSCATAKSVTTEQATNEMPLVGKGVFTFDYQHINKMKIWYYIPTAVKETTPILFVMHGVKRNADEYRDGWIQAAENSDIILVVPEYSQAQFPRSRSYNLGNMYSERGQLNPENLWSYNLIEPIFDIVKAKTGNNSEKYHLFGHSAGAQFVHRYLLFASYQRLGLLMAANAGWYTTLDDQVEFPYGLKSSPKNLQQLENIFSQDVMIMLGELDNDANADYLRQTPEAKAQGAHRFARGNSFFEQARQLRQQQPFNWQLITVPNVGHNNKGMAHKAVKLVIDYETKN
ncbi:MAG: alpha/beta hydrolase [Enterobacterales bacterium]|nr:alpha/beta hydrolase [Enterobacterales bacterium]